MSCTASAAQRGTLKYMAKRLLTLRIDEGLLGRVDVCRGVLGQTRTLFVSRALEAALGGPGSGDTLRRGGQSAKESGSVEETAPTEDLASPQGSVEPVPSEAQKPPATEQASPGLRSPSGGVRLAAPVPGVMSARDLMLAKQRLANEARAKKK